MHFGQLNSYFLRLILAFWAIAATEASAQSMQVIGGDSFARECYQASSSTSMTGFASGEDLIACDRAISHGNLRKSDRVATYVNRGVIKVALEDFQGAVQDYNLALKLDDSSAEAYANRGNMWFVAGRFQEAIKDYERSLELELGQAHVAHLNRGMALETIGQWTDARQAYQRALELQPEWAVAQAKLDRVNGKLAKRNKP